MLLIGAGLAGRAHQPLCVSGDRGCECLTGGKRSPDRISCCSRVGHLTAPRGGVLGDIARRDELVGGDGGRPAGKGVARPPRGVTAGPRRGTKAAQGRRSSSPPACGGNDRRSGDTNHGNRPVGARVSRPPPFSSCHRYICLLFIPAQAHPGALNRNGNHWTTYGRSWVS